MSRGITFYDELHRSLFGPALNLSTKEALKVYGLLYGVRNYRERIGFLIDESNLGWSANKKVGRCLQVGRYVSV